MLSAAGFDDVVHVVSCAAALLWLEGSIPKLAILDLEVADGTTAPVAERLREVLTPCVVYSGHARGEAASDTVFDHAIWLAKPCTEDELLSAVRLALGLPLR